MRHLLYKIPTAIQYIDKNVVEHLTYYLMYDDSSGKRYVECVSEGYTKYYNREYETKTYILHIDPWLRGIRLPEKYNKYMVKESDKLFRNYMIPKYDETLIDKLYNWYCKRKGRHMRKLSSDDLNKIFED